MAEIRRAKGKKVHIVWITITGMIFMGSFLIGSFDISERPSNADRIKVDHVQKTYSSELVSDELERFFRSFDTNRDGRLQLNEAQDFYYWVEENMRYRSDGESVVIVPTTGGTLQVVNDGDGRSGSDYRQTPTETFEKRAGDCEDMATLEVAFFNYYGIEAYVVAVNAKDLSLPDHAFAIVRLQDLGENINSAGLMGYTFTVTGLPVSILQASDSVEDMIDVTHITTPLIIGSGNNNNNNNTPSQEISPSLVMMMVIGTGGAAAAGAIYYTAVVRRKHRTRIDTGPTTMHGIEQKVTIDIIPKAITIPPGETVTFYARAYDKENKEVNNINFSWSTTVKDAMLIPDGRSAKFTAPGQAESGDTKLFGIRKGEVIASYGNSAASANVEVNEY